jgi:glycosyltransferase involved in cell wall biosynthesis
MWYWEFGQAPPEWRRITESLDEVWAPSRFVGHALREILEVPVMELTPGVEVGEVIPFDRSLLGVPQSHTLFLFIFDACSVAERKNPLGLITAFRRAFRSDDKTTLVIKAGNLRKMHPEEASQLRAAARQTGTIILDQTLPRGELNGLIQACDCYVSLHRSEGLGLTMAEAMLLGKPVIGTAYSANLEFMDRGNSLLIGYELVPVGRQIGPYSKDLLWADPSVGQAAEAMRWVHENANEARALGARARISAEETLSLQAAGKRFARRLEEIKMNKTVRLASQTGDGAISKSPSIKGQH